MTHTMMAKPIKTLELHHQMIQFLLIPVTIDGSTHRMQVFLLKLTHSAEIK